MQFQSFLIAIAILSRFALFGDSRAIQVARQDQSLQLLGSDVYTSSSTFEPRMLRKLKDKVKPKKKEDKDSQNTEAGESSSLPAPPPGAPPRYEGPPPNGMASGPEREVWDRWLDEDLATGRVVPEGGSYLMYSGTSLSKAHTRNAFKAKMVAEGKGQQQDWSDTYFSTDAQRSLGQYEAQFPEKKSVVSYIQSWGQARRAAHNKEELDILLERQDSPIMTENTYWGAVEAGVITGPDSKVNKIYAYSAEDLGAERRLIWDRDVHQPFGRTDADWTQNPRTTYTENPLMSAVPKV
ncbi:hypothetical protein J1614_005637 [Plenodomus biglobosus]|nr:hypothetical protein J1614_005637 [Plenodomus biglobosus]